MIKSDQGLDMRTWCTTLDKSISDLERQATELRELRTSIFLETSQHVNNHKHGADVPHCETQNSAYTRSPGEDTSTGLEENAQTFLRFFVASTPQGNQSVNNLR